MAGLVGCTAIAVTRPLTGSTRFSVCPLGIGKGPSASHEGVATVRVVSKEGTLLARLVEAGGLGVGGRSSMNRLAGISENSRGLFSTGGNASCACADTTTSHDGMTARILPALRSAPEEI